MPGWVKWEKDIETDPRFVRMVRKLRNSTVTGALPERSVVTLAMGALLRFWSYADTHLRADNTLDLGMADINDLVAVDGFAEALPEDWLIVIDEQHVELPAYQEHSGVEAKKKALTQKRVETHRKRMRNADVTPESSSIVNSALPDQTKTRPDLDQEERTQSRPKRRSRTKASAVPISEFHQSVVAAYHELCPTLPRVEVWTERRRDLLEARIQERCAVGKPADTPEYWHGFFENVAASDFLSGRVKDWRADFQWLLDPEKFVNVMERKYANNTNTVVQGSFSRAQGGHP